MKRTTLTLMLLAAGGAAANLPMPAWAEAPADLRVALDELKKAPDKQDGALVDTKLGAAISASAELSADQYRQARLLQEQRRVAALADKTAPQKRQLLNQAAINITSEVAKQYLADEPDPAKRFDAHKAQLALAGGITDSAQAKAMEGDVVKAMLADLDQRYLGAAGATDQTKEAAIAVALKATGTIKDATARRQFTLAVYDRYGALGTPGAKAAIIGRAGVSTGGPQVAGAQ